MNQDPADKVIEDFFNMLKIESSYYSIKSKQPILLIGEKYLYKAIKEAIDKVNNFNNSKIKDTKNITEIRQFKQLPSFNPLKLFS